ncbi:MAG: sulfurtransferase-like selenium metabolism protein YedF [Salinivirgaceae bacterium]|jgi:selenium metabolism protein YedF
MKKNENTLIQVNQFGMGQGNDELGLKLIGNYFKILVEDNHLPRFIAFYNSGVKIICKGSPIIEVLKTIESMGVKLLACKTCLDFYELTDKIEVGVAGTMHDIVLLQANADKVITL